MKLWWLSFASSGGFRGVVIVEAPDFLSAISRSWDLGLNPGGEVVGHQLNDLIPEHYLNRLILKPEIYEIGANFKEQVH